VDWNQVAQDRDQYQVFVDKVMNHGVSQNREIS
jgi:hypothetical protein